MYPLQAFDRRLSNRLTKILLIGLALDHIWVSNLNCSKKYSFFFEQFLSIFDLPNKMFKYNSK
jgi:hypothetical protein